MNVLVIGSGGREHALGWKIKQSSKVGELYFAPGNAGTELLGVNVALDIAKHDTVATFCEEKNIELVVIGPDDALAGGLTNSLEEKGIAVFGPTKEAAQLEWSKSYAKEFMHKYNIPTAKHETFTNSKEALVYIETKEPPFVIKADGLALGKGVVIANTQEEAQKTIIEMIDGGRHGAAGRSLLIEEFLEGKEISVHAFCDGTTAVMFPSAQDHKRAYENDEGPNTGGMGTIVPVPGIEPQIIEDIQKTIIEPTLEGMKKQGTPFRGVLFPGVMITKSGPKVIEFNARFGDPETQSYMRLLETDLVDVMLACINGTLSKLRIKWKEDYACCVVIASGGYPGTYEKGKRVDGPDDSSEVIFHAGTKRIGKDVVTSGGRVLGVTAIDSTLQAALTKAYAQIEKLHFKGMQYRKDIGQKCL